MERIKDVFTPGEVVTTRGERYRGVEPAIVPGTLDGIYGLTTTVKIAPDYTLEQAKKFLGEEGKKVLNTSTPPLYNSGGISDKISWWHLFRIPSNELRLREVKEAFEQGISMPIVPEYWKAFEDSLLRTPAGLFQEIHNVKTYEELLELPFVALQEIGWKKNNNTPEGKSAKYPDWTFSCRKDNDTIELAIVAKVPYKRGGISCFLTGVMPGFFFPQTFAWVTIGARTGDSLVADAVVTNSPIVPVQRQDASQGMLYIEGVEEFHSLVMARTKQAVQKATKVGKKVMGIEFLGLTELAPVGVTRGWPKAVKSHSDLRGLDFWVNMEGVWVSAEDLF